MDANSFSDSDIINHDGTITTPPDVVLSFMAMDDPTDHDCLTEFARIWLYPRMESNQDRSREFARIWLHPRTESDEDRLKEFARIWSRPCQEELMPVLMDDDDDDDDCLQLSNNANHQEYEGWWDEDHQYHHPLDDEYEEAVVVAFEEDEESEEEDSAATFLGAQECSVTNTREEKEVTTHDIIFVTSKERDGEEDNKGNVKEMLI